MGNSFPNSGYGRVPPPLRGKVWSAILGLVAALGVQIGPAAADGCGDAGASAGVGIRAIDGDTFVTEDGREWRLAGVLAPKRGDGARAPVPDDAARSADRSQGSPADAAHDALAAIVTRQSLWLTPIGDTVDRYGRRLAAVRDATCRSVAERLLAAGHGRVYPTVVTRTLAPVLYGAEASARTAARGLWADGRYRLLRSSDIGTLYDAYVVVEDRPVSVITARGGTTLVFGEDARRDFGVTIAPKVRTLLKTAGFEPAVLVGRQVRVRGWLRRRGGAPVIDLMVPEQLEVVGP